MFFMHFSIFLFSKESKNNYHFFQKNLFKKLFNFEVILILFNTDVMRIVTSALLSLAMRDQLMLLWYYCLTILLLGLFIRQFKVGLLIITRNSFLINFYANNYAIITATVFIQILCLTFCASLNFQTLLFNIHLFVTSFRSLSISINGNFS